VARVRPKKGDQRKKAQRLAGRLRSYRSSLSFMSSTVSL
jgi:hypothetical protein